MTETVHRSGLIPRDPTLYNSRRPMYPEQRRYRRTGRRNSGFIRKSTRTHMDDLKLHVEREIMGREFRELLTEVVSTWTLDNLEFPYNFR